MKAGYNNLPNLELIRNLYELYYVRGDSAESNLSSHWRQYSQKLTFRLDGAGIPTEVSGYGFGDLERRTIPFRVFSSLAILSYLVKLPERSQLIGIMKIAWPLCRQMGLTFTQDAFRQVCSLALIDRHLSSVQREKQLRVIMIGDGYGLLASLVKERFPNSTIILVDVGKVLLFQAFYCQKAHPDKVHESVLNERRIDPNQCDFVYCPAEFLDRVSQVTYDLSVNIASMQEMTADSVTDYFHFLRQHKEVGGLFYCCNRERKVLVGGEVQEFARYPWHADDVHLVDERCPWHQHYFSFSTYSNGPRLLGIRIPFVNYFDGPIRHRLTQLSREH